MKTVLYNLLCTQPQGDTKFHGGGEYGKTIFRYLAEHYSEQCQVIVFYNKERFLDEWLVNLINRKAIKTYDVKALEDVTNIFLKEKINTYYSPLTSNEFDITIPANVRKVATIHGLRNIEMPVDKLCIQYGSIYMRIKSLAKLVLKKFVISKHEKETIRLFDFFDDVIFDSYHTAYGFRTVKPDADLKKIHIQYCPIKHTEFNNAGEDLAEKYGDYILLLGGNRWLKNPYRALIAISHLLDNKQLGDRKVIVVGKLDDRFIKKYVMRHPQIINLEYATPNLLEDLYKNCELLMYPTLNEGFGSPPLEAMRYGKNCLVSAVCSLPEIYADSVYYMNPYDIREMENRILNSLEIPKTKDKIKFRYDYIMKIVEKSVEEICELIIG